MIWITGGQGSLGTALQKYLVEEKKVEKNKILITKKPQKNNQKSQEIPLDLGDEKAIIEFLQTYKPTQIYHLVGSFSNDFATDFHNNVLTTKNIFEA